MRCRERPEWTTTCAEVSDHLAEGSISDLVLNDGFSVGVEHRDGCVVQAFRATVVAVVDHNVVDWSLQSEVEFPPGVLFFAGAGTGVEGAVGLAVNGVGCGSIV